MLTSIITSTLPRKKHSTKQRQITCLAYLDPLLYQNPSIAVHGHSTLKPQAWKSRGCCLAFAARAMPLMRSGCSFKISTSTHFPAFGSDLFQKVRPDNKQKRENSKLQSKVTITFVYSQLRYAVFPPYSHPVISFFKPSTHSESVIS